MADSQQQPIFAIEKLYVKDCSWEHPHAPEIFAEPGSVPNFSIAIEPKYQKIDEAHYEVSVRVTVTAKYEEDDKTVFICEATQAGIFQLKDIPENDLEILLEIAAPNILFPYVRQVISTMTTNGGFPAMNLQPFNFEVYYQQKKEAESKGQVQ